MLCKAIDCDRKSFARGMCQKHWSRWRKGKDINEKSRADKSDKERFFEKIDKTGSCWLWTGGTRGRPPLMYGSAWIDGDHMGAHRYSYIIHHGEIPELFEGSDSEICHKCDNPLCVNPDHLFLGNHTLNMRDKISKGRCAHKNKTHCPAGHEYNEKNTYLSKRNMRHCKECHRIRQSAINEKKRKIKQGEGSF